MIPGQHNQLSITQVYPALLHKLAHYLANLSAATKSRFGPHAFDLAFLTSIYNNPLHAGFVVVETSGNIAAYAVVKSGYLEHDQQRLASYGLTLSHQTDCTFAPSVADAWQDRQIGRYLFDFIRLWAKEKGFNRIILWGGVQANNMPAIKYYRNLGFCTLGSFEYYGTNEDMILEI